MAGEELEEPGRRVLLRRVCGWALLGCVGCGREVRPPVREDPAEGVGDQGADLRRGADMAADLSGWTPVKLGEHPELEAPGGWVVIEDRERLLNVHLVHDGQGRYRAIWRICTHGACAVEVRAQGQTFYCPCHGSMFGASGEVFTGPAREPLRQLRAVRRGPNVWIEPVF